MHRTLTLVLALAACGPRMSAIGDPHRSSHRTDAPGESAPEIGAEAVLWAYARNSTAADRQYDDKVWLLTGVRVNDIEGLAVWMTGEDGKSRLRLKFSSESDILRLSEGMIADAQCEGDGHSSDDVHFEDCELVSARNPEWTPPGKPSPKKQRPEPKDTDGDDDDDDDDAGGEDEDEDQDQDRDRDEHDSDEEPGDRDAEE